GEVPENDPPRDGSWKERGNCWPKDPHDHEAILEMSFLFLPEEVSGSTRYSAAEKICQGCPVKTECLEYSLDVSRGGGAIYGMWGGKSPRVRVEIARRRGRPMEVGQGA